MTSHTRQKLREAFRVILAERMADHTVFATRIFRINEDSLPIVDIKFTNENSVHEAFRQPAPDGSQRDRYDRTASLSIRITRNQTGSMIDNLLDDDAVLVEEAVAQSWAGMIWREGQWVPRPPEAADDDPNFPNLRYMLVDLMLIQTNFTDDAPNEGGNNTAEVVLRYDMIYRTFDYLPSAPQA